MKVRILPALPIMTEAYVSPLKEAVKQAKASLKLLLMAVAKK